MSGTFNTDLSHYPVVVVTIPRLRVPDADVLAFIDGQREMLGRRTPHVLMCDARAGHVMPATQRKMFGDWLKEAEPATRRYTAGMAIIVDNGLIRGALTAVLWVVEPACPTKAVATWAEGAEFLEECGRKVGLADVRATLEAAERPHRAAS